MNQTKQLAFNLPLRPSFSKEDFLVAKCNIEAVRMIDSWPDWSFFALCIYGVEGSGKTHLANVWANNVYKITQHPYRIPFIKAKSIKLENVHKLFEQHYCLVVEDLDDNINFEAMFHLYNLYKNEGGFILFTSKTAPARLNITLADLQSRMNAIPSIEIKDPDDDLLSALVVKHFSDRQIMPTPEIVNYILKNCERSFSYIRLLIEEIDNISLSKKSSITINVVKEAIEAIRIPQCQGELF